MKKYLINWSETLYYSEEIEAETEDKAIDIFNNMELGYDKAKEQTSGEFDRPELLPKKATDGEWDEHN